MRPPRDGENVEQLACPTPQRGEEHVPDLNPSVKALVLTPRAVTHGSTLVFTMRYCHNPPFSSTSSCGVLMGFPLRRPTEPDRTPPGGRQLPPACTPPEHHVLTLHGDGSGLSAMAETQFHEVQWHIRQCRHWRSGADELPPARESKLCCRESKLCFLSSRRTMASADFCFFTMPHLSHPQALFHTLPVTDAPFLSEREALQCLLIHPMPAPSRPGHLLTAGTGSPATPPRPHPP